MLIGMGNTISFVGLVLFVVLVVHIYWSQQYLSRMVDIFKVRDELAEKDQEIDEQNVYNDKSGI